MIIWLFSCVECYFIHSVVLERGYCTYEKAFLNILYLSILNEMLRKGWTNCETQSGILSSHPNSNIVFQSGKSVPWIVHDTWANWRKRIGEWSGKVDGFNDILNEGIIERPKKPYWRLWNLFMWLLRINSSLMALNQLINPNHMSPWEWNKMAKRNQWENDLIQESWSGITYDQKQNTF